MEKSQLVRMIRAESMTYAVLESPAGCAVWISLNAWVYKPVITNYFGTPWKLPVIELLII
jgi:putative ABC transport system permease protein